VTDEYNLFTTKHTYALAVTVNTNVNKTMLKTPGQSSAQQTNSTNQAEALL
jgi:hypothetical protein